jgi:hypothetical protein
MARYVDRQRTHRRAKSEGTSVRHALRVVGPEFERLTIAGSSQAVTRQQATFANQLQQLWNGSSGADTATGSRGCVMGQGAARAVYRVVGLPAGRAALDRFCRWSAGVRVAELSRLARTVRAWEAEILAWHVTSGCSNGRLRPSTP